MISSIALDDLLGALRRVSSSLRVERPPAHFDRIRAARDLDHRRIGEMLAKRAVSIVAEVTISFRSRRFASRRFR